jgi:hypothetical protein
MSTVQATVGAPLHTLAVQSPFVVHFPADALHAMPQDALLVQLPPRSLQAVVLSPLR